MIQQGSGTNAPRVASVEIVDDHILFAEALADLVRTLPDFSVAGVAATGGQAIATAAMHRPDLILLDYHLPGQLATDILPEMRAASPRSRIIVLTSDTSVATRAAAMRAGFDGFLTKEQALDDVADALRTAMEAGPLAAEALPRVVTETGRAEPTELTTVATSPPPPVPEPARSPQPVAAIVATTAPPAASPVAPTVAPPVAPQVAPRGEAHAPRAQRGSLVAVYAAKGGVGATTVATNLAVALATDGARAAIVDLDVGFGDVGIFLDLDGGPGIAALRVRNGGIDAALVIDAFLVHSSGLRVLPAPTATRPEPAAVGAVLEALREHFTYVVCDLAKSLTPLAVGVLRAADRVVLVTTPELPALRDLERVLAISALGLRPRALLVVNRHPGRAGVRLSDIERGLGLPIALTIPSEGVAVTEAINRGVPVAGEATPLGEAFRRLAEKVAAPPARA